MNCFKKL